MGVPGTISTNWTEDQDAYLRQSYRAISASQIGEYLGKSRCAVIGRASRIGLGKPFRELFPEKPQSRKSSRVKRIENKRADLLVRRKKVNPEVEPLNGSGVKIWELNSSHCRWVVGEPSDLTFCGHEKHKGSSYCATHNSYTLRESK